MRIVADENIPYVHEAFGTLGEVVTVPGRGLRRADLAGAELLLVRSVTRVDEALLAGTPVRFVASATIGFDHIDADWLAERGIPWATAPGCNAVAAAEYVTAAVLRAAERLGWTLAGRTAGIIGCGNVGSRVLRRLTALGLECLVNDPPRAEREGAAGFVDLDTALGADIVTCHVPLTRGGPHPTVHLLDRARLARLRPGTLLINTARGPVVDNTALLARLDAGDGCQAILDVWEGEPALDPALLDRCLFGTPHIAGYSLEGRARGTEMIYQAVCRFLGVTPTWRAADVLPPVPEPDIHLGAAASPQTAVAQAVRHAYDIEQDDATLRATLYQPRPARAAAFDRLRKEYPLRREFAGYTVHLPAEGAALAGPLDALGFQVAAAGSPSGF